MAYKNNDMHSGAQTHLRNPGDDRGSKIKRALDHNGLFFRNSFRLHNRKMGEITAKLLNLLGATGVIFAFLANLPNAISVSLGMMMLVWLGFRVLKMREDWLMRRSERRVHERENKTKK